MKKVLVVTPRLPFDMKGACEQDRAQGIHILSALGYEVSVLAKARKKDLAAQAGKDFGVKVTTVLNRNERTHSRTSLLGMLLKRAFFPPYWDGAAFEYTDPEMHRAMKAEITAFKPDVIWFDYTYLWPLFSLAKSHNIPIITRSLNYEPGHYRNKSPKTFLNLVRFIGKLLGERVAIRASDLVVSINPKEKGIYERMGTAPVVNLPLRRISTFIGRNKDIRDTNTLNIFFIGSNYMVPHMIEALTFILEKVNPLLQERYPGVFSLHVVGAKTPQHIRERSYTNVTIHGYIEDLDAFMETMDIALSPALYGEGMHQKVFEPIVRGIPTVTTERGLGGYALYDGVHVLTAHDDAASIVEALGKLIPKSERVRLSQNAVLMAQTIFSEALIREVVDWNIKKLTS